MIWQEECEECVDYREAGIAELCPACRQDELDTIRRRQEEEWVEPLSP